VFEIFSPNARTAVVHAQEQARMMRTSTIAPAHLLIGLALTESTARELLDEVGLTADDLRDRYAAHPSASGLDNEALADLGIDVEQLRDRVESAFGKGALDTPPKRPGGGHIPFRYGHIPFADSAKKSLERALHVAQEHGHRTISSAHVLLGALDADPDTLSAVLPGDDTLDRLREATVAKLDVQAA
jgi:ATP-dependent Clp protease ATP-binding subunit ClpA